VSKPSKELSINKGIELMLRRDKKETDEKPSAGFAIKKTFSFLKRKVYFNFELRWEKQ
tara:strand:- start:260 stop:433 length:174 start_codon:yes stop_codon:yes gene_type:complete